MKGCLENRWASGTFGGGGVGLQIFPPVHKAKPAEGEAGGVARLFFPAAALPSLTERVSQKSRDSAETPGLSCDLRGHLRVQAGGGVWFCVGLFTVETK